MMCDGHHDRYDAYLFFLVMTSETGAEGNMKIYVGETLIYLEQRC